MAVFRRKSNLILTILLVAVVVLGGLGFYSLFKRVDKLEPTKTVSTSAYSRGLLSDTTGKLPKEKEDIDYSGIHTNGYINVDGLICEIVTGAKIRYQINYYTEDYGFIGVVSMTTDYDSAEDAELQENGNFETAKYVKIEIIPTADPDGEVSIFEVASYAKLLNVTYNK